MHRGSAFFLVGVVAVALAAVLSRAHGGGEGKDKDKAKEPTKAPAKEPAKKPATHKVEKKPFRVELALKGVLEPAEAAQVVYRPEPLAMGPGAGPQTIRTIVAHGATVAKGDVLVTFDTRKLDQLIHQMEADLKVTNASIELAEREQPILEKSAPLELAAADRSKREADEDLDYWLKTGKATSEKRALQMARFAAFNYEFAKEQLRQLEKMYKANDLTEETEQIILKRQRFDTEEALLSMKQAEIERDLVLKTISPRKEKSLREQVVRQTLALQRAKETGELALAQKRASLMKMRFDADKLNQNLALLKRELQGLTIAAPADGIVYHGKFAHGQWEASPALAARLVPNGTISPEEVFMTIVKNRPLVVKVLVEEKDAHLVKSGLEGKMETVFNPEVKGVAKVAKIATLPSAPGKFEALINVEGNDNGWMPGMACSLKFVPYSKKDAVAVPAAAVFEEDDERFVYVVGKQGKEAKRVVSAGRTSGGRTEILTGLKAGDEILLERPADKKSEATGGD